MTQCCEFCDAELELGRAVVCMTCATPVLTSLEKAAPDLLAALKELVDIVDGIVAVGYVPDLDSFALQPARAAIAKARGEQDAL